MKTIAESATILNAEGYITARGVSVIDLGDTLIIGVIPFPKFELEISDNCITSKNAGWAVILN